VTPAAPRTGSVSSRPVKPPARPAAKTRPGRTTKWQAPPPQPPARKRRRPFRGLFRFIRFFLSVLVLVTVPLVAMVAAYSVIAGVTMEEAVGFILDDVQRLLERV
jgi:hypothetical protein